ncbi:MAG: hypothetical protein ACIAS6_00085 [Phycisphaerales bacterium JB060]
MGSQLPRKYVTACFREKMVEAHPGLDRNPAYWRLVQFLLFGALRDDSSGRLVLPNRLLAEMAGKERQHEQNNFNGRRFLEEFERDVAKGFTIDDDWSYVDGKARTVVDGGLDPSAATWATEMAKDILDGADVVDLESGMKVSRAMAAADERTLRDSVASDMVASGVACETRLVVEHQNARSKRGFSAVVRDHLASAEQKAWNLADEASRRSALQTLASIKLRPRPLIQPKENSPRAFSVGASLLTLKSSLRREFARRWVDYDLKSAQLAIVGRQWDCEAILDILNSDDSVWTYLADALGVPRVRSKEFFKKAIYALVFGAARSSIVDAVETASGVTGLGERFLANEFVHEVYEARERALERVLSGGGATTELGRHLAVGRSLSREMRHKKARSILAQVAQATELLLIHPVYEVAKGTTQFDIMLYQFDGVTIRYRDARSWGRWHKEVRAAVSERAKHLRVDTGLESTKGEDFDWT